MSIEITDWYGKPFQYDVEKYSRTPAYEPADIDSCFLNCRLVLADIFQAKTDEEQREWWHTASNAEYYLFTKLGFASRIYIRKGGSFLPPKYLTPQEFVDRYVAAEDKVAISKSVSGATIIHSALAGMLFDVDQFATRFMPFDPYSEVIFTCAMVVKKTSPYVAKLLTSSSDLKYHMKRWGFSTDITTRQYFDLMDKEIEKRGWLIFDSFSWI